MEIESSEINGTQPQPMNVVVQQPQQISQPKKWKRGLMSCCNDGVSWKLLKTFCCPFILFGELSEKTGYGNCCLCGFAYFILFLPVTMGPMMFGMDYSCCVHFGLRKKIREIKGLPKKPITDCFVTWCCGCCALSQEAFEMDS